MGMMFIMVYIMKIGRNEGYYCPFCGAKSEDDHEPGCHGRDRW